MNLKFSLFFMLFCTALFCSAQTQLKQVKNLDWYITRPSGAQGESTSLTNYGTAMIVNASKGKFAISCINEKLEQQWITPLEGFAMTIGKFKGQVLVVAATDKSMFKGFSNHFIGYLIDEKTGKINLKKTIYQGSETNMEEPHFFFGKNGSFFKITVRVTSLAKKMHVGMPSPLTGLTLNKIENNYASTLSYAVIDFDSQLEQYKKTNPKMPDGQAWNASIENDGSLLVVAKDIKSGKINVATYLSDQSEPLKTVSFPLDMYKETDGIINVGSSTTPLISCFGMLYKNSVGEKCLLTAKVDFSSGTVKSHTEVIGKKQLKELEKSYVATNNKFGNVTLGNPDWLYLNHVSLYGDQVVTGISTASVQGNAYGGYMNYESVMLMVFDIDMKPAFRRFIPRNFLSMEGEGLEVAYNLEKNVLKVVVNQQDGTFGANAIYTELDLKTGQMPKMNLIAKGDMSSKFCPIIKGIFWHPDSFTIPYMERKIGSKSEVQLFQLTY